VGRLSATQLGSWTTDLVSLSLSGPVVDHTLTVTLDSSQTSSGTTSIVSTGDNMFSVNSFFDVFVELGLDTNPPLTAVRGPIQLTLSPVAAVPELSTWAMMILGFGGIGAMPYRRHNESSP
jgi:hypothetical protein